VQKLIGQKRVISLRCRMPGKFLEKAREQSCRIIDAHCAQENTLTLTVSEEDAQCIRELAHRYSQQVLDDRAVGPDIRRVLRRALPFALGFALVLAAFGWTGRYVWLIDVRCPDGGEESTVYAAIEEAGVFPGGEFPQEDPLARELESLCPGYAHISVRREGVALRVEAYRETDAPQLFDAKAERDIVAKHDAVIEEVTVLAGTAAVKSGDVVKKGQVIILGQERATDESMRGVRALGEAKGMVWAWAEEEALCAQEIWKETGNVRMRAALRFAKWEIPLMQAEDFDTQSVQTQRVDIAGIFVPLYIERQILRETKPEWENMPLEEQKAALEAKTMASAMAKLPQNAQIIDKWTDYSMMEGNRLICRLGLQARVSVAAGRDAAGINEN